MRMFAERRRKRISLACDPGDTFRVQERKDYTVTAKSVHSDLKEDLAKM